MNAPREHRFDDFGGIDLRERTKSHANSPGILLAQAKATIRMTSGVKERAAQLLSYGIKSLDALHLALAEAGGVDYFCNCDNRLQQRARRIEDLATKVVSPLALIREMMGS
jgi:predicted nucleic acid-binding protein